ncbi:hypothetical protein AX17_003492 [Amanita inopinata Kibby_2008]|nr:hypothetical protein AX17_003492 [Amanita inopinata Kibby_2008]
MPKKKSRSKRAPTPPPPPVTTADGDDLVDDLLAQLDTRHESPLVQEQTSPPLVVASKQNAKSRFISRKARKAATLVQSYSVDDTEVQDRLQREINEEEDAIERICDQLGLTIFHINPDGHCLFSAIADQLSLLGVAPPSQATYIAVRRAAADYIQSHPDDFLPFLPSLDSADANEPTSTGFMSPKEFEQYCASIRNTAEWGGELEVLALCRAYNISIHVVQSGSPSIVAHNAEGDAAISTADKSIAFISYHRRMYGLGEHYNSLHRKGQT